MTANGPDMAAINARVAALVMGLVAARWLPERRMRFVVLIVCVAGFAARAWATLPRWDTETTATLTGYAFGAVPLIMVLMMAKVSLAYGIGAALLAVLVILIACPRIAALPPVRKGPVA